MPPMFHHRVFGFGTDVFDPSHRFETSWLLTPWALFFFRAIFAFYALVVLFFNIIWESVQPAYGGTTAAGRSFSYFTILTYWGLAFYFLVASIHTFTYARTGTPLLNRFPRFLQALHSFYYTTIITYPFLVTIVFWAVLYSGVWWPQRYYGWSNISEHAMNSLFALFELIFPRTTPPLWIHILWLLVVLALYLGLAYLTYDVQGWYVYSFLDPRNGHRAKTVGYILGIAAGIIVIFCIVKGLVWLRKWVTEKRMGRDGKFHGGRAKGQGDVELESARMWEK